MNVHSGERRVMLTARLLGRLWVVVDGQVVDTTSSRRTRSARESSKRMSVGGIERPRLCLRRRERTLSLSRPRPRRFAASDA